MRAACEILPWQRARACSISSRLASPREDGASDGASAGGGSASMAGSTSSTWEEASSSRASIHSVSPVGSICGRAWPWWASSSNWFRPRPKTSSAASPSAGRRGQSNNWAPTPLNQRTMPSPSTAASPSSGVPNMLRLD